MEQVSHVAKQLKDIFAPTPEQKERKVIETLPPVFLRLYGDIDYGKQLEDIPEKFRNRVIILTTKDTPQEKVSKMQNDKWTVVQSQTIDKDQANRNASLLLNEGIRFAKELKLPYIFFLSSGFQRNIDLFYSMYYILSQKYPNQDAYYFLLPETHANEGVETYMNLSVNEQPLDQFLTQGFPFETALIMKTSMPEFETEISQKGALGETQDGIPLGGMEFFMTLLATYKYIKQKGKTFAPRMLGITFPILTRAGLPKHNMDLETAAFYESAGVFELVSNIASHEVTPSSQKLARRLPTIHAALQKLRLTQDDIQKLFSNTLFDLGIPHAFHFIKETVQK